MTRFYALWVHHKGACWTVWLGCPKDKIVRLVRLFHRHSDKGQTDLPWTAPVIPLRALTKRAHERRRQQP